jgi:SNF2 family DNA or RNA helicase
MNLRPYQVEGAAWLAGRKTALLADEMRLGKSAQAITAAKKIGARSVNVICPASVVHVWENQFRIWWPESVEIQVKIGSYGFASDGHMDSDRPDVLIPDEIHYLKGRDSQRTQKVFGEKCDGAGGLVSKSGVTWGLTGTPAPNHPAELWPMLRAMAPEIIMRGKMPMGYFTFLLKFCNVIANDYDPRDPRVKGGKNLALLKQMIAPFVLRRRYADVAKDMPPLQIDVLPVVGSVPDEGALKEALKNVKDDDSLIAALKRNADHIATLRRLTGLAKVKGLVDWFRDWREGGGGKVVFFAHHRDVMHELIQGLEGVSGHDSVAAVDGSMAQHARKIHIRHFEERDECVAFVGQLQAAGVGIDLSAATTAIFVETSWVPGENQQAMMRIQKVGKTEMCQVYLATLPGSIDERVQMVAARKMKDAVEVFG